MPARTCGSKRVTPLLLRNARHLPAGLLPPSGGRIDVFGERLAGINRRASYMFQQDALLPWKTVLGNIQLGLMFRGRNGHDALENAQAWLERVGLDGFGNHYPYQLSGGMRKRVAMAQCWIVQPDLILMDEPFKSPDKRRPVLVLTRQEVIPLLHSVMVAPITSVRRGLPSEVPVGSREGLKRDSAVNLDHVQTVERARLISFVGSLNAGQMRQVCRALAVATGCAD